ncbi:MAG: hypothetical protein F4X63_04755 [Nitrospira sp. SB0662_bin_26]|nr:hypothetical protein [Nitrospira sp. SB0662_bin_26]
MFKGPERILVDSSFFFALFDPEDDCHNKALKEQDKLDKFPIIVPWPILYETINSKFVKSPATIKGFENIIRQPNTKLLDDSEYRNEAYQETLALAKRGYKRGYGAISLVDSVLHAILKDVNVPISAMLTFDYRDFVPICASRNIEVLSLDSSF